MQGIQRTQGMRDTAGYAKVRRTAAAALIGAALTAGTAGCGAGTQDKATPSASQSHSHGQTQSPGGPPGPPGPPVEQLKAFALAPGDKAGPYEATEPLLDEPMSELYEAKPEECGPLTSLGKAGHTAQAYAKTGVPGEWQAVGTDILLRSYKDGGSAAAMKALAEAGRQCAGGYTEDRALAEGKVLKVEPVKAPALGDEALAYRIVVQDVKDKDISLYKYLTVIRSGPVTLSFRSDAIDTKDFGGVPAEVVTAQWEKFAKASGAAS
ncbi:hypothetical protein OHB39_30370 [Streptomyces sp. NBC_00047]|uniref:hypothetical protein n=1 Tax=Streptomyces sp. NBC_00047 TaxID=2975627 RepID=UPI00224ED899|nr:hypothetical protein [Streptomyces sp. NBC_00047]MCX5611834.1 hypothetical protein [Streptomyces sp. NBC_00047]